MDSKLFNETINRLSKRNLKESDFNIDDFEDEDKFGNPVVSTMWANYDEGDDRSQGSISAIATLDDGSHLTVEGRFHSEEFEEFIVTINGQKIDEPLTDDMMEAPPHRNDDVRLEFYKPWRENAERHMTDIINNWLESYYEYIEDVAWGPQ